MINKKLKAIFSVVFALVISVAASVVSPLAANADEATPQRYIQISPTKEYINLQPGQEFVGSYKVSNIGSDAFTFEVGVTPYSVQNDKYDPDFTTANSRSMLANWISFSKTTYTIEPNSSIDINYTVNVPEDVPGGGQYAALTASVRNGEKGGMETISRVAMILYAKMSGETRETGNIIENKIPGIVFGGNKIEATSLVENTGNIHAEATYTIKVFPFGSDEESYTNEENPETTTLLPDTKRYHTTVWEDTPQFGLYTVEQTIEFMGQTSTTSKLVLVCPVWLIVIFIALILAIIFTVASRARARKQDRREATMSRSLDRKDKSDKKDD